jgi:excisionase family DNA binding protein
MGRVRNLVGEIITLMHDGWAAYRGRIEEGVYDRLRCHKPGQAAWFVKGETYLCLGCDRRCLEQAPDGFQLALPAPATGYRVVIADAPALTVRQLLDLGRPLRIDEVAYCMNVSRREVYYMIEDGRLQTVGDGKPVRVTPESVRQHVE